jgi:hypothetical protein
MRAAATSLGPKKHPPKSFRPPVGIAEKESGGVYRFYGQREGIDCRSAGWRFQELSVIAVQRSAVCCNDLRAPFSGLLLESSNLKTLVLHSSTGLRLYNGTQR